MLVGRQAELATLTDLLRGDRPVVVLGEPGIGKTALLHAALHLADRPHLDGGALASLRWMEYLPIARALGARRLHGDPAAVATRARSALGDGALLVVEDLHWADEGTLSALELLAPDTVVVATARPAEPAASELVERLRSAGFATLELAALDDRAAGELVRSVRPEISDVSVARIVRRSGGVPLLLSQLAGPEGEGAESLRIALSTRLRAVSPTAADAFSLLALIGRPIEGRTIGVAEADELQAAGLLRAEDDGLVLQHAVLGDVAIARLSDDQRRSLHLRAAEIVRDPGEAARHLEAAGERSRARTLALQAADEAVAHQAEAAAHLAVAARCSEGHDADDLRLRAANGLVVALRSAEALTILDAMDGDNPRARAEAAILRSRALWYQGDDDGFRRAIDEAMEHGRAAGPAWEARAMVERSRIPIFLDPDVEPGGVSMAEEALTATRAAGNATARAEMLLGLALYMDDRPAWRGVLEGSLEAARREGDLDTELLAANNLVTAHESSGDPERGRSIATEMIARSGAAGMTGWQLQFRAMRLNLDLHAADYGAAVSQAVELLDEPLDPRARAQVLTSLVFSLIELGRFDIVDDRLGTLREQGGDLVAPESLRWLEAEAALHGGRPADARRLAREAIELGMSDPFAALVEIWAGAELGDRVGPLDDSPVPMFLGVRPESEGVSALASGDSAVAATRFDEAASLWGPYHRRGELRCRWAAAEALRRAGERDVAQSRLLALEDELSGRGMTPMVARVHRSLRELGVRRAAPRSRRLEHGLTEREAEVMRLVAGGLSNAEIGRRLRISRSTVTELVGRARDRLGASSRGQAASMAVR